MFITRSHSPKAPATRARAIIVSHGQPSDPMPAEATLAGFAGQIALGLPGWQVESATLAAPGALDRALAATGQGALVYPLFMTAGWFTTDALRARLADQNAHVLAPFGTEPELPAMAAAELAWVLKNAHWRAKETQLFIAAHGSGRSPRAAEDTHAFAGALRKHIGFAETRVGFVEEAPRLAEMAKGLGPRAICLPFFASAGGHVLEDIPEALDRTGFTGIRLPPIGCFPGAPALVAQTLGRTTVPA